MDRYEKLLSRRAVKLTRKLQDEILQSLEGYNKTGDLRSIPVSTWIFEALLKTRKEVLKQSKKVRSK